MEGIEDVFDREERNFDWSQVYGNQNPFNFLGVTEAERDAELNTDEPTCRINGVEYFNSYVRTPEFKKINIERENEMRKARKRAYSAPDPEMEDMVSISPAKVLKTEEKLEESDSEWQDYLEKKIIKEVDQYLVEVWGGDEQKREDDLVHNVYGGQIHPNNDE
jgi:hypothetical protein